MVQLVLGAAGDERSRAPGRGQGFEQRANAGKCLHPGKILAAITLGLPLLQDGRQPRAFRSTQQRLDQVVRITPRIVLEPGDRVLKTEFAKGPLPAFQGLRDAIHQGAFDIEHDKF
jgi:hypothetical protein